LLVIKRPICRAHPRLPEIIDFFGQNSRPQKMADGDEYGSSKQNANGMFSPLLRNPPAKNALAEYVPFFSIELLFPQQLVTAL
jgi:hypothetical protein